MTAALTLHVAPAGGDDPHLLDAEAFELEARAKALRAKACRLRAQKKVTGPLELVDKTNCRELTKLTPRAFEDAARAGKFPARKVGRHLVAARADVESWLQTRRVQPRSRPSVEPEEAYAELVRDERGPR